MKRRLRFWIALLMLAALAFSQASFALAQCGMERGEMGSMAAAADEEGCCAQPEYRPADMLAAACLSHCTADLQLCGQSLPMLPASAGAPAALWPERAYSPPMRHAIDACPVRKVPARILLHSFLI